MRDALPKGGALPRERGIVNLDDEANPGSHWTAYQACPESLLYFDSYGLPPPQELVHYLRKKHPVPIPLHYSTFRLQRPSDGPICGHLCINVLRQLATGRDFLDTLLLLNRTVTPSTPSSS